MVRRGAGCVPTTPRYAARAVTRSLLVLVLLLVIAVGCGDWKRHEARLLLDRMDRIDVNEAPDARRPEVEALEQLPLESTEARRVRDLCVKGHEALLSAEQEASLARGSLDRDAPVGSGKTIPAADARRIDQALVRSNDALAHASRLLVKCQDEVASLSSRYGRRR